MVTESNRAIRVDDATRLNGKLAVPEDARAGVLVLHPHPLQGGSMDNHVVKALADACAKRGLAALRFDFRHAFSRESVDLPRLLKDADADARAAFGNLRAALPEGAPVAVAGYSFGGLIALRTAARESARAVAAVGFPVKGDLGKQGMEGGHGPGEAPVLVMQGRYDETGTPDAVREFLDAHDVQADVRTVPDASHGYFAEAGFVARIVAGFLAKRLG